MSNLQTSKDRPDIETKELSIQAALLQIVQRTDIDPERLEKFLDLQIKMEERQAEQALNKALSLFQLECPIITKTKRAHNSNYAPYDEIKHVIKPIAEKHGLSWSFSVADKSKEEKQITVTVRHKDGASFQSNYSFPSMDDGGKMNNSQRTRSANSYAKRTALENALDIVSADEDDDARRAVDSPITKDQIKEIVAMLNATKSDEQKFLNFMKVNDLGELTEFEGKKAISALKQKRSK